MSRLIELLEHWSGLEPERCSPTLEPEIGFDLVSIPGWTWSVHENTPEPERFAKAQLSIQQAIAARHNWDMTLQSALNLQNEVIYFAIVRHSNGAEFVSEDEPEPAIALLEAYLAALKAALVTNGGGVCDR